MTFEKVICVCLTSWTLNLKGSRLPTVHTLTLRSEGLGPCPVGLRIECDVSRHTQPGFDGRHPEGTNRRREGEDEGEGMTKGTLRGRTI